MRTFFLLACTLVCTAAALPPLSYRYAVFAVKDPNAAGEFFSKYTGASKINPSEYQISKNMYKDADVCGTRLLFSKDAGAFSDVYFVHDATLEGAKNVSTFGKLIAESESFAQDDWTWWQDWHLAFSVDDLDAVAARLLRDNVKFVNRGSIYFPILDTGITIQVLGRATIYWSEPFLFCRHTDDRTTGKMEYYPTNVTDIANLSALQRPLPMFIPSHQSMASSSAGPCANWAYTFLNVSKLDTKTGPGESHEFANGTCADIRWMEISPGGWAIHFIEQFEKREGKLLIKDHEQQARSLHGNMSQHDAFMDFRVGLSTSDIAPYIAALEAAEEPFLLETEHTAHKLRGGGNNAETKRILLEAPNGYVFEICSDTVVGTSKGAQEYDDVAARLAIASAVHE